MRTSTTHRRRAAPGPRQLRVLVESLDRSLVTADEASQFLIAVMPRHEIGLLPLPDGAHPLDLLTGWHAPHEWAAVGVSAGGRSLLQGAAGPPGSAVHLVLLVSRSGATAAVVRPGATEGTGQVVLTADPPGAGPEGRLVEACLRAMRRPTRPPPPGTAELWARKWLDAVMAAAAVGPVPPLCWPEVAARHPHAAGEAASVGVDTFIGRCADTAADLTWGALRRAAAAGAVGAERVTPIEAAWMDDGMFARELLASFPEPTELLADLTELITVDALAAVHAALAGWGVQLR